MSAQASRVADVSRFVRSTESKTFSSDLDRMQTMAQAFPKCEAGILPFGSRVLIQIRSPKTKSGGGIEFVQDTIETEKWNQQVGLIAALGPVAFCDRKTGLPWIEGQWAKVGKFVRFAKYGGDKWEVALPNDEQALFMFVNDVDLLGEVTCDPRAVKAFI